MLTTFYAMLLTLFGCLVMVVVLSTAAWAFTFIKAWGSDGAKQAPTDRDPSKPWTGPHVQADNVKWPTSIT